MTRGHNPSEGGLGNIIPAKPDSADIIPENHDNFLVNHIPAGNILEHSPANYVQRTMSQGTMSQQTYVPENHVHANNVPANYVPSNYVQANNFPANYVQTDTVPANYVQANYVRANNVSADNLVSSRTMSQPTILRMVITMNHIAGNRGGRINMEGNMDESKYEER